MCQNCLLRKPLQTLVHFACVAAFSAVVACQVPVFRYALERWNADIYQVVVLSDGPLDAAEEEMLAEIRSAQNAAQRDHAKRVELAIVDANKTGDPKLTRLWKQHSDRTAPLLAAFYPPGSEAPTDTPAYQASLTKQRAASIVDSPVRQEIANRLMQGHSAVWIFVPSGNPDQDKRAYETLEEQIKLDADWLKLPSPQELEVDPEVLTQCKIKLRIEFSIVTLQRDNEAERFLLDSLLNSEPDLRDFDQPLAFPVFGRGRVLYALVGKGIVKDTIRSASSFMAGPCSCQVKNQNPGFDLLLMADWETAVGDTLISEPIESASQANLEPVLLTIPPGSKSK